MGDFFAPLWSLENTAGECWMKSAYNEEGWESPYEYPDMDQSVSPGNLQKRPIPFLFRKKNTFEKVIQIQNETITKEQWQKFLEGKEKLVIPPHTKVSAEISAGVERTAYLRLVMEQGKSFRERAEKVQTAVREFCTGKDGMAQRES